MVTSLFSKRALRVALASTALAAIATPNAWAALTVANTRAAVTADTTINWGILGGDLTGVGAMPSVGIVTATGAPAFAILEQGQTATYNFSPAESLLAMLDVATGDLTSGSFALSFSSGIAGFGTQIQGNLFGPLNVTMTVFNTANLQIGSFIFTGATGGNNDGSALFVGVNSTAQDIGRVVLSGAGAGAAINQLTLDTVAVTPIPEPGTAALLMVGLSVMMGGAMRRRKG
jgi:hypothetical protein